MAANLCMKCLRMLVWSPLQAAPSCGMKSVNTRFKRPMHITRAKLMEVTKYQRPVDTRRMDQQCSMRYKGEPKIQPNLVQAFLANQCRRLILSHPIIAVYQNEGLALEERIALKRRLGKADIGLEAFSNAVMGQAIAGTALEHMRPLLYGANIYALGPDGVPVKKLLKIVKKYPRLHLLGGLVENRLMSAQQMYEYAQLPDMATLQGQLAGLLSHAVGSTHGLLQQNQQALTASLDQLARQREETIV